MMMSTDDSELAEAQYQALLKVWKNADKSMLKEIIDSQRIFQTIMDDTYLKPKYVSLNTWHRLPLETRNLFLIKGFEPNDEQLILGLSVFSAIAGKLVWNLVQTFGEEANKKEKYSEQITTQQIMFNFWVLTKRQSALKLL